MKKITRLLAVSALCGASLLYVGCAKDYTSDIEKVQKNLDELASGKVATQAQQIAALETAKATLESNVATLTSGLKTVNEELATAKADLQKQIDAKVPSGQVTALSSKVTTLETQANKLSGEISTINTTIAKLESTISGLSTKSYVDATFATKTALAEVEKVLGELVTKVGELEKANTAIASELAEVSKTATKAAEDIKTAMGKVEELEKCFTEYYKKGVIDAKIQGLRDTLALLNQAILTEESVRDNADGLLQSDIDALDASIEELKEGAKEGKAAIAKLQEDYSKLSDFVDDLDITVNIQVLYRIINAEDNIEAIDSLYKKADSELKAELLQLKEDQEARTAALEQKINNLRDTIKLVIKNGQDSVIALKGRVSVLAGRVAAAEQEIDQLQADLQDLEGRVAANEAAITRLEAAIQQEKEERVAAIEKVQSQIDDIYETLNGDVAKAKIGLISRIGTLEGKVEAISGRVTSISVCPSNYPEGFTVVVPKESGDTTNPVIIARFQIEPAEMAAEMAKNLDNLTLNLASGKERVHVTSGVSAPSDSIYANKIYSASAENGVLKVVVNDVNYSHTTVTYTETRPYFSLTYSGEDNAGKYSVTSDYVQIISGKEISLDESLFGFAESDSSFTGTELYIAKDTLDYKAIAGKTYNNFKDWKCVNFILPSAFRTEPYKTLFAYDGNPNHTIYPVDKVAKLINLPLVVDYNTYFSPDGAYGDVVVTEVKSPKYESNFTFKDNTATVKYINKTVVFTMVPTINGQEIKAKMKDSHRITKVFKDCTKAARDFYLYWNYLTYKAEDRKDTLDLSKDADWKLSSGAGYACDTIFATAGIKLGGYNEVTKNYGDTLTAVVNGELTGGPGSECTGAATFTRTNDTDSCMYTIGYTVEKAHANTNIHFGTITVPGSVTKNINIDLVGYGEKLLKNENGEVDPVFFSGLGDADKKYSKLLEAFKENAEVTSTTIDGKILTYEAEHAIDTKNGTDTLELNVNAGQLGYNETHTIAITATVFGFEYTATFTVKTEAPKFKLVTRPYIQSDTAFVDGKLDQETVNHTYKIDAIHYYNHVQVEGLKDANEEEGTTYKVVFTPAYEAINLGAVINPGLSGVEVDSKTGMLIDTLMQWGDYTGRNVNMVAHIVVGGYDCSTYYANQGGDAKAACDDCIQKYVLHTESPVVFETAGEISLTKKPKEDLPFIITSECVIYGRQGGQLYKELNLVGTEAYIKNGKIKQAPDYGCQFKIQDMSTISAKVNGVAHTLYKDVDYTYDEESYTVTLKLDNIYGTVEFDLTIGLEHYLDYNHAKAQSQSVHVKVNID